MRSSRPVGVRLSGGLDSRSIHYLASQARDDVTAFTIDFDEARFSEGGSAAEWARLIGTPHQRIVFSEQDFCADYLNRQQQLDEPHAPWCNVASAHMARCIAASGYKVVLGGDGGDELFAGYSCYRGALFAQNYRRYVPYLIGRHVLPRIAGAAAHVAVKEDPVGDE